jgi:hypothetical protein
MNRTGFAYRRAADTASISDLKFLGATSAGSLVLSLPNALRGSNEPCAAAATSSLETDTMTKLTPDERAAIAERLAQIVAKLQSNEPISILQWVKLYREKRKLQRKLARDEPS